MKIGLVGEAPNDTQSIKNLLEKRYTNARYEFVFMLNYINGSNLDNQKNKNKIKQKIPNKIFNLQKQNSHDTQQTHSITQCQF
jgi:hypothetical protein